MLHHHLNSKLSIIEKKKSSQTRDCFLLKVHKFLPVWTKSGNKCESIKALSVSLFYPSNEDVLSRIQFTWGLRTDPKRLWERRQDKILELSFYAHCKISKPISCNERPENQAASCKLINATWKRCQHSFSHQLSCKFHFNPFVRLISYSVCSLQIFEGKMPSYNFKTIAMFLIYIGVGSKLSYALRVSLVFSWKNSKNILRIFTGWHSLITNWNALNLGLMIL